MHELKHCVANYIHMEKMQTLHTWFCNDYTPSTTTPQKPPPRPDSRPREPRQPRFTRYASLSVPRSRLLDEALYVDLIPPSRKPSNPPNADMTKYCRYHRNNGHTTNECKALQDKIEELVRVGHFCRFVRRDERPHPSRFDHRYPPAVLATTDAPPNQQAKTHNLSALTSPRPIPRYTAQLTPSLKALLAADPPPQLERNISANCSPLTT